jgi:hypothetical protein
MNLPFIHPESSLFRILSEAAVQGDLPVYSVDEDGARFKNSSEQKM